MMTTDEKNSSLFMCQIRPKQKRGLEFFVRVTTDANNENAGMTQFAIAI